MITKSSGFLAGLSLLFDSIFLPTGEARQSAGTANPAFSKSFSAGDRRRPAQGSPPPWPSGSADSLSSEAGQRIRLSQKAGRSRTTSPQRVRMAEWSKAPDSRCVPSLRAFWSPNGGVGSNPTSDRRVFATFREHFLLVLAAFVFCFWDSGHIQTLCCTGSLLSVFFSFAATEKVVRWKREAVWIPEILVTAFSNPVYVTFCTVSLAYSRGLSYVFPGGLVVRIRRSHRRGPGSIPGQGKCFCWVFCCCFNLTPKIQYWLPFCSGERNYQRRGLFWLRSAGCLWITVLYLRYLN